MLKATKIRIYPTAEQEEHFAKSFGCCRFAWNYALNLTNETYKATGKGLSRFAIQKEITKLKKELEWLSEPYSQCLQVVALNLSRAFINFFEGRSRYPRFKSKHHRQSISYPQNVKIAEDGTDSSRARSKLRTRGCRFPAARELSVRHRVLISFPKLKEPVMAVIHRPIEGTVKTVTVTKSPSGKYYASVLADDGKNKPERSAEGKAIGIDLGITDFAVTSDGSKFNNPHWMKKHERNLERKQCKLSRKKLGSNKRHKARKLVARVHEKVRCCREDFLHKLSRRIVDENQVIAVENLNVKGMVRNPNLAKAISQVGWGMFCTMLKYKSEWEGKVYLEVDRFFPSSKTCHVCLNQVGSLPLDVRSWTCNSCMTHHDRDTNAAINIKNEALRLLSLGTRDTALGGNVRLSGGRKKSTTEQLPVSREATILISD